MEERIRPRYVISIAAEMLGVRTHTLRYYERVGIIKPYRSQGRIRLYSESDIERLRRVKTLMADLGVNIAGIEVILNLLERMAELQATNAQLISEMERLSKEQME